MVPAGSVRARRAWCSGSSTHDAGGVAAWQPRRERTATADRDRAGAPRAVAKGIRRWTAASRSRPTTATRPTRAWHRTASSAWPGRVASWPQSFVNSSTMFNSLWPIEPERSRARVVSSNAPACSVSPPPGAPDRAAVGGGVCRRPCRGCASPRVWRSSRFVRRKHHRRHEHHNAGCPLLAGEALQSSLCEARRYVRVPGRSVLLLPRL